MIKERSDLKFLFLTLVKLIYVLVQQFLDNGLFKNNLPCGIILNIDKALRGWRFGSAIYQKNDSWGIYKDAEWASTYMLSQTSHVECCVLLKKSEK